MDAIRAELLGEPEVGNALACLGLTPRPVGLRVEIFDQSTTEEAFLLTEHKTAADIQQQGTDGVAVFGDGAEGNRGIPSHGGEETASEVGEDEQGFPNIGGTVVQRGGDVWLVVGDGVGIIENEAGALALEVVGVQAVESFAGFAGGLAVHADDDAAVGEGFGQMTNGGHDLGAPGRKSGKAGGRAGIVGCGRTGADADDVRGLAGVAGVENATKLFVALEEGVGFVDEEGGPDFLDDAEEGGGADVSGDDGPVDELAEDGEESSFAAALFGGLEPYVGADLAQVEGVGVESPKGESFGAPLGQNDVSGDEAGEVFQEEAAVDWGFPGGDVPGSEDWGLDGFGRESLI